MTAPSRPALRYHGGKWRVASWIIAHFPAHRCYVEPFGGGASVLLRKPKSAREVYNDLDEEVVGLFRVLRDPPAALRLLEALRLTPFARTEFEDAYLPTSDAVEQSRRLIIRSYMGFGSSVFANHATGFRDYTRSHGDGSWYPARDWSHYPECLSAVIERLRDVVVDRRDALEVIQRHDAPDTLFYVDPPYVLATRGSIKGVRQKYRFELDDDYHRRLAALLRSVRGTVVLSGYPSALYEELYPEWRCVTRTVMADGAVSRTEALWLNPPRDCGPLFLDVGVPA